MSTQRFEHAFHPLAGATAQQHVRENIRVFQGTGTPYLPVPGLSAVESVALEGIILPETIEYEVPVDPSLRRLEKHVEPTVLLDTALDGTPVLRRHMMSNDGIWQKGHPIYVCGRWQGTEPEPPAASPATEAPPETLAAVAARRGRSPVET